jgi:hypothetical protein
MPFTGQLSRRSAAGRTWAPDEPPKSTRIGPTTLRASDARFQRDAVEKVAAVGCPPPARKSTSQNALQAVRAVRLRVKRPMKASRCRPSPAFSTASKVKWSFTQRHASNEYGTRGVFQLYVIAALCPANYHQKIGTTNRSIQTPPLGDCTADLDVVAVRMNVLPGNSRHPIPIAKGSESQR